MRYKYLYKCLVLQLVGFAVVYNLLLDGTLFLECPPLMGSEATNSGWGGAAL